MEIKDIIGLVSLLAMVVTALWAYTKYFLERGFLPPIRFYVTLEKLGQINDDYLLDIKIHLHNIGSTTLIARNIRLDLRYLQTNGKGVNKNNKIKLFADIVKNKKVHSHPGRLIFPNSVIADTDVIASTLEPMKIRRARKRYEGREWQEAKYTNKHEEIDKRLLDSWSEQKKRGFLVIEDDTFVQAGVDQIYTFVTKVPKETICCLTWCSFQYAQEPKSWQKKISGFSRAIGLIQYTLEHVHVPHTVEDVFWIADTTKVISKTRNSDDSRESNT